MDEGLVYKCNPMQVAAAREARATAAGGGSPNPMATPQARASGPRAPDDVAVDFEHQADGQSGGDSRRPPPIDAPDEAGEAARKGVAAKQRWRAALKTLAADREFEAELEAEMESRSTQVVDEYNRYWWAALPCYDENDDGVPPFCKYAACPLDHRNACTNDNAAMHKLGNVGFPHFDAKRSTYMGFATVVTFVAMGLTTFGCFALSTDKATVLRTYWAWGEQAGVQYYAGLRSVVRVEAGVATSHEYGAADVDCAGLFCGECRSSIVASQIGCFMSCFTLIFALLGTMNRMKVRGRFFSRARPECVPRPPRLTALPNPSTRPTAPCRSSWAWSLT